jgi:glycosyltransferase involved in cell wall biosynthesis
MEKNFIKDQVTVVIPVYNEERFLRKCNNKAAIS